MPADGLAVLLRSFHLPTMAALWEETVGRAERENWGYKRLLQHLCESEEQDRRERKTQRLLKESGLPDGKTLGNLEEKLLPTKIRRLLPTLLEGHFVRSGRRTSWPLVCRAGARRISWPHWVAN